MSSPCCCFASVRYSICCNVQVEERGGFIWLFWGDKGLPADERPPIPFAPELEDPTWKAVYGEIEFECGHWGEWVWVHLLGAMWFGLLSVY